MPGLCPLSRKLRPQPPGAQEGGWEDSGWGERPQAVTPSTSGIIRPSGSYIRASANLMGELRQGEMSLANGTELLDVPRPKNTGRAAVGSAPEGCCPKWSVASPCDEPPED